LALPLFTPAVRSIGLQAVKSARNMKLKGNKYRFDHRVIDRDEDLSGSSILLIRVVTFVFLSFRIFICTTQQARSDVDSVAPSNTASLPVLHQRCAVATRGKHSKET
jgi:hypothetical protein